MERIYEHVPDWFTLSCWVVGGLIYCAVVIPSVITWIKKHFGKKDIN